MLLFCLFFIGVNALSFAKAPSFKQVSKEALKEISQPLTLGKRAQYWSAVKQEEQEVLALPKSDYGCFENAVKAKLFSMGYEFKKKNEGVGSIQVLRG